MATKWSPTRVISFTFVKSAALSFASSATAVVGDVEGNDDDCAAFPCDEPAPHATKSTDASASALPHTQPVFAISRRIGGGTQPARGKFTGLGPVDTG